MGVFNVRRCKSGFAPTFFSEAYEKLKMKKTLCHS
jgi:hypothetical protein